MDLVRTRHVQDVRRWAEERGAVPVLLPGRAGIRFDFGETEEVVAAASWDAVAAFMGGRALVFEYQKADARGRKARHARFVAEQGDGTGTPASS